MKGLISKAAAVVVAVLFGMSFSNAQTYEQGDKLLNIGLGVGGSLGTPIGLSYEYGFTDKISGGVYLGYASKTVGAGAWEWKWTHMLATARASYHFDFNVDKLDPYLGVSLGYNYAKGEWVSSGSGIQPADAGGLVWGLHAGARYFFSEKFGVFAEAGYGIANLNVGLAFKF